MFFVFNCKFLFLTFSKTDILLKFYNFFFYVHFFPLSFRRKKKETNQRKKKETGAIIPRKIRSKSTSEFLRSRRMLCANISTKMLVKHSHFRDVCSVFTLDLMLCVVAGATRQYFMYEKPRACLCERVSVSR